MFLTRGGSTSVDGEPGSHEVTAEMTMRALVVFPAAHFV